MGVQRAPMTPGPHPGSLPPGTRGPFPGAREPTSHTSPGIWEQRGASFLLGEGARTRDDSRAWALPRDGTHRFLHLLGQVCKLSGAGVLIGIQEVLVRDPQVAIEDLLNPHVPVCERTVKDGGQRKGHTPSCPPTVTAALSHPRGADPEPHHLPVGEALLSLPTNRTLPPSRSQQAALGGPWRRVHSH